VDPENFHFKAHLEEDRPQAQRGGETVAFESRHPGKDGTVFPVREGAGATKAFLEGGRRLKNPVACARDITSPHKAGPS